jgi:hypothetical protein
MLQRRQEDRATHPILGDDCADARQRLRQSRKDAPGSDATTGATTQLHLHAAGVQSKSRNRQESPRAPTRNRAKLGLCAAEPRQSTRSLTLDQRLQRLADERRLLLQSGIFSGFGQQFVVDCDRGSHCISSATSNIASFDVDFHATFRQSRGYETAGALPPSVTSTISGGTPRRKGMMLQPRPPETMTSHFSRACP